MNDEKDERQNSQDTISHGRTIPRSWSTRLRWMGPGIITAALVLGPGSLTVTSSLGASYGFTLLWVIVVSTFFMAVFLGMSIRIGLATDCSLLTTIRKKWGNVPAMICGIGVFLVTASFQAGNSVGAGLAFSELTETSITPWIVFFTLLSAGLLYFRSFYKILERLMIGLVSMMLVSFLGTLLIIRPSFGQVSAGLIPRIPEGSIMLAIALVASSFSIVGAFYQSYLVQEKKWKRNQLPQALSEGFTGIALLGIMGGVVLICAGAVLHPLNLSIGSAADMGRALEPLFGNFARVLFMLGLFGASFSSLIGNSTLGGTLLSDALGYGSRLENPATRVFIMLVMATGALVAVWFGGIPIDLIVFAQGLTIFIVPFIGIILFITAKSDVLSGDYKIGSWSTFLGYLGILLLFALAFRNASHLLGLGG